MFPSKIKIVNKPWGKEEWLSDGSETKFAFKKILIKAPKKSSIQFHEFKEENIYIASGSGLFHYHEKKIDVQKFKNEQYSIEEINTIISEMKSIEIGPGFSAVVKVGTIHSVEALTDITIFEASTTELEDVFRLNDEYGRDHGHIKSEHEN